jgi:hypothetical protein
MPNSVSIVKTAEAWVVRLVEDGARHERTFELEAHATNWAMGQAHRLKVENVDFPSR